MSSVIDRADMMEQHQDPGEVNVKHRFTADELRALRECNRESFYYRCLPIGTTLTVATYFAVKNGYLKPSVRFGATPKMFLASVVGYFIGKFSYQSACLDKLMKIPNSQLAEQLRQRKGLPRLGPGDWGGGSGDEGPGSGYSNPSFMLAGMVPEADSPSQNVFTDVGDTRPLDSFDTDPLSRSQNAFVMEEEIPLQPATKTITYDELRRANRDEFYRGRSSSPIPAPRPTTRDERSGGLGPRSGSPAGAGGGSKVKNKYGDVWEETD